MTPKAHLTKVPDTLLLLKHDHDDEKLRNDFVCISWKSISDYSKVYTIIFPLTMHLFFKFRLDRYGQCWFLLRHSYYIVEKGCSLNALIGKTTLFFLSELAPIILSCIIGVATILFSSLWS